LYVERKLEVLEAFESEGAVFAAADGCGKLAGLFDGGMLEALDGFYSRCVRGLCGHGRILRWLREMGQGGVGNA